jgi:outer membrane immunogenic protein
MSWSIVLGRWALKTGQPLVFAALLLLLGAYGPACAGGSLKDGPSYGFSWTGFYIGGHAGLTTGNTQGGVEEFGPFVSALTATDYSMDGAVYGVHGGYNYQSGNYVLGIEGSFSSSDASGNTTCVVLLNCKRELDWVASLVGRLGYAMDRNLVYVKGGVAWADLQTDVGIVGLDILSGGDTHTGWVVGFGFEHAMTDSILLRIDYSHMDFGSETHELDFTPSPGLFTVPSEVDAKFDTLKIGVSVKF